MQNVFLYEIEAAYMRGRLQDAAAASGLAAQAIPPSTSPLRHVMPNLILAFRQAGEVIRRPVPMLQSIPGGKELPAVQG